MLISQYEDRILELIDNQDKFTRSDLQGAVGAVIINILNTGIKMGQEVMLIRFSRQAATWVSSCNLFQNLTPPFKAQRRLVAEG